MTKYEQSVAVLIETVDTWGRNVVEAVARYAQWARWALVIAPRDAEGRLRLPQWWRGQGAIVMLRDTATAEHVRRMQIPPVDVDVLMQHETWLGRVVTDDAARARMALEHFRERSFEHFAYYAPRSIAIQTSVPGCSKRRSSGLGLPALALQALIRANWVGTSTSSRSRGGSEHCPRL